MMKIIFRSIALGLLLYFGVALVANISTVLSFPGEKSPDVLYVFIMKKILGVWVVVSSIIMFRYLKLVRPGPRAAVVRSVFIYGPIWLGWFFFESLGRDDMFLLGTLVSSVFLMYEFVVVPNARKNL